MVTNEAFSSVSPLTKQVMVRLLSEGPGYCSFSLHTPSTGLFCYPSGIGEHTLKVTGLAKLSCSTGEETKFQRLRGGSGVAEALQQYLKPSLATLLCSIHVT